MPGLLFNSSKLQQHKITRLLTRVGKLPKTKDTLGIVFILSRTTINKLTDMSSTKEKMSFMDSTNFINDIQTIYFIFYNKERKLIEMRGYSPHIENILHAIIVYAPRDVTVWTGIIPPKYSDVYLNEGFDSPYITNKSPLGYKFVKDGLAFYRKNIHIEKVDLMSSKNIIEYIESQRHAKQCVIYAKFTPDAISYLYGLNNPEITVKNKKIHNRELAGTLKVSNVIKDNGKIIFELSGDPSYVKTGIEEEVGAVWGRYNFHTHPHKAYVNHGVKNGWPSAHDYLGFIQLKKHTIFHAVVTLEGIYVISFGPNWSGEIDKIDHKYIIKNYDIDHNKDMTYKQYEDLINTKKYKGGSPLFDVKYFPWDVDTSKEFPIFYFKTGTNCLATDTSFDNHMNFDHNK